MCVETQYDIPQLTSGNVVQSWTTPTTIKALLFSGQQELQEQKLVTFTTTTAECPNASRRNKSPRKRRLTTYWHVKWLKLSDGRGSTKARAAP